MAATNLTAPQIDPPKGFILQTTFISGEQIMQIKYICMQGFFFLLIYCFWQPWGKGKRWPEKSLVQASKIEEGIAFERFSSYFHYPTGTEAWSTSFKMQIWFLISVLTWYNHAVDINYIAGLTTILLNATSVPHTVRPSNSKAGLPLDKKGHQSNWFLWIYRLNIWGAESATSNPASVSQTVTTLQKA